MKNEITKRVKKGEFYWSMYYDENDNLIAQQKADNRTQYDDAKFERKNYFYTEIECTNHINDLKNK